MRGAGCGQIGYHPVTEAYALKERKTLYSIAMYSVHLRALVKAGSFRRHRGGLRNESAKTRGLPFPPLGLSIQAIAVVQVCMVG